jgi:hypothetical protein
MGLIDSVFSVLDSDNWVLGSRFSILGSDSWVLRWVLVVC